MKETYHSPELQLLCFAPAEELASGTAADQILGTGNSGNVSGVLPDIGDIDISIG